MKTKVYIDGSEGTTGLRINERFKGRDDIEILTISSELRKDIEERRKFINASDITFLCLPDAASIEAVSLIENDNVRIIDASTAHRTNPDWAYGFPELSSELRDKIKTGKRIAVPGCHASGFNAIVYPLVKSGIMPEEYPVVSFSLTGYSGGGKKMIADYENEERDVLYDAPREYALTQKHKHLREMKAIPGLKTEPIFTPIVSDYYSGMVVSVPVYTSMLKDDMNLQKLQKFFEEYYKDQKFMKVMPLGVEADINGFLDSNGCSGWDGMEIFITGNDERVVISARFDNLGKGASGAAIECMNIMLGCDEAKGLEL